MQKNAPNILGAAIVPSSTLLNYPEIVKKYGVTLFKQTRATNMAFADDINILARSRDSALSLLAIFQKALDWTCKSESRTI